jgi:phosphoserine phosphatase
MEYKMRFRIVAFDLDGVLVDTTSSWCWVHRHFKVNNDRSLKDYLDGKIDDIEFMRRDISLWLSKKKDVTIKDIADILESVPLMPGAKETVRHLENSNIRTAIISSGLGVLANRVADELGISYVLANDLKTDSTGKLLGEGILRVQLLNKGSALSGLLRKLDIAIDECITVGNSYSDATMFDYSGLSIAFNPVDDIAKTKADIVITKKDLREILKYI